MPAAFAASKRRPRFATTLCSVTLSPTTGQGCPRSVELHIALFEGRIRRIRIGICRRWSGGRGTASGRKRGRRGNASDGAQKGPARRLAAVIVMHSQETFFLWRGGRR